MREIHLMPTCSEFYEISSIRSFSYTHNLGHIFTAYCAEGEGRGVKKKKKMKAARQASKQPPTVFNAVSWARNFFMKFLWRLMIMSFRDKFLRCFGLFPFGGWSFNWIFWLNSVIKIFLRLKFFKVLLLPLN